MFKKFESFNPTNNYALHDQDEVQDLNKDKSYNNNELGHIQEENKEQTKEKN